jgi:ribosomal protein S18 acetylase RimI-like enzyme
MTQQVHSSRKESALVKMRVATHADRDRLVSLVNSAYAIETFLEGTRTDDERMAATMEKGDVLVLEEASGQLLGCVYVQERGARGYLGMLAVDPAHQGSGLAIRLLRAAEDHLRRQGCEAVDITVLSLRPELLPIYRRFGFVETGTKEFTFPRTFKTPTECHCIVMSKPL